MFSGAEATFITWAGSQLLHILQNDPERALQCRTRVAKYFREVGACLSAIAASLRSEIVPRVDGHRLEALIDGFELIVASNFQESEELQDPEGKKLLGQLRQAAYNATLVDGQIYRTMAPDRHLIEGIERVAGRFLGIGGMLEAIGPFKLKPPDRGVTSR